MSFQFVTVSDWMARKNVLGEKGKAVVQRFGFPEGTIEVIFDSVYCKASIFRKGAIFGILPISFWK